VTRVIAQLRGCTMDIQLQELIEKIKREGVEAAKTASAEKS
jgi:hypothetical protein